LASRAVSARRLDFLTEAVPPGMTRLHDNSIADLKPCNSLPNFDNIADNFVTQEEAAIGRQCRRSDPGTPFDKEQRKVGAANAALTVTHS
jgi:hypothetical protein